MGLIAFLIAVLYVCLGFAAGTLLSRRNSSTAAPAGTGTPLSDQDTFNICGDQAAEFIDWIHNLTTNVNSDVDRHSTRVAEISGGLAGERQLTISAAEDAATQLLEANHQLQTDLASAKEELRAQRELLDSYMAQALTDPLTGLGNRRKFDQELARRFAQWRRGGTPLSLVMVDVDHFKRVNDVHGHKAGDAVLHEVAGKLIESVRDMDIVARYGGEEFGIILPGTTLDEARPVAERIRSAVAGHTFQIDGSELRITVSAGLAEAVLTNDCEVLVTRADTALYAAKEAGRNCCHTHDGQNCLAVPQSVIQNRRKADCRQRIAPFVDGQFPEAEMFQVVNCEDVFSNGFTYLVHALPAYDKLLVALGDDRRHSYSCATVKHCRFIGSDHAPMYRVSCQFTGPLDCFDEATAS